MRTRNVTRACRAPLLTLALAPALCVQAAASLPGTRYLHADHLGSIVGLSDGAGDIARRTAYRPYGSARSMTRRANGAVADRFTGKARDAGTGLYYFGARYHDPALGRFLEPDAARQTRAPYVYVAAAPLLYVDPDGRTYEEYARRALSLAAHERDMDWRHVRDPGLKLKLLQRAREYANERGNEIQGQITRLTNELAELTGTADGSGESYRLMFGALTLRRRCCKALWEYAQNLETAVSGTRKYMPHLYDVARNFRFNHFEPALDEYELQQAAPEYASMLSRLDYAATWAQQVRALRQEWLTFRRLYQESLEPVSRVAPRLRGAGLNHLMPYRTLALAAKNYEAVPRVRARIGELEAERDRWMPSTGDYFDRHEKRAHNQKWLETVVDIDIGFSSFR